MITPARYLLLRQFVAWLGFGQDLDWSEDLAGMASRVDPDIFGLEAAYVIVNSGMRWTVAGQIWDRVRPLLLEDRPVAGSSAFGHPGKVAAIDHIWAHRVELLAAYLRLGTDAERLDFLGALPWVGPITKFHLGKNLGLDVAKPDRWLVRLAHVHGLGVQEFCQGLGAACGDPVVVVDTVLWRVASTPGAIGVDAERVWPVHDWLKERWNA